MAEVMKQRLGALSNGKDTDELRKLLEALVDGIRVVTAQLDADAGVTGTTFTANFDAVITK